MARSAFSIKSVADCRLFKKKQSGIRNTRCILFLTKYLTYAFIDYLQTEYVKQKDPGKHVTDIMT